MKKVLIIDESSHFKEYLSLMLEKNHIQVIHGRNGLDGFEKLKREVPDLVIMDYYLSRRCL